MITTLLFALSAQAAIFGANNSVPVNMSAPYADTARSVAIAMLSSNFAPASSNQPGKLDLTTSALSELVCKDQPFYNDPSMSYSCTGFLVAPDLLVTAGHCSVNVGVSQHETETYCKAFSWLFDYQADQKGNVALTNVDENKLYHCKETIFAVNEEVPPYRDFALIRLDRKVTDRKPIPIAKTPVKMGDAMSMLGFPMGTPMKFADHAKVTINNPDRNSFITNLDAFDGNSGSPVLNAKNEVVGILIAGTPAPAVKEINGCNVYERCDDNGQNCLWADDPSYSNAAYQGAGSEVERIQAVQDLIDGLPKSN